MLLQPAEVLLDQTGSPDAPVSPLEPPVALRDELVEETRPRVCVEAVAVTEEAQPLAPAVERDSPFAELPIGPQAAPVGGREPDVEHARDRRGELPVDQRDRQAVAEDDV